MMFTNIAAAGRYQQALMKNRTVFALLNKICFSTDQQPPSAKLVK